MSDKMTRKCILHCVNKLHGPFTLQHEVPFILGRSRETLIKDSRCSKRQVRVLADCKTCQVNVSQIGVNTSGVAGIPLTHRETVSARHNDIIEVLLGLHKYKIVFEPPPDIDLSSNSKQESKKASSDEMPRNKSNKEATNAKRKNYFEDFGVKEKKNKNGGSSEGWEDVDNGELLLYNRTGVQPSKKIAAYDMDGTLILTKSGKVFAVDYNDWKIIFNNVSQKLKELIKDGYKIVVFSNQAGIAANKQTPEGIKGKFDRIRESLGVPMQMLLAAGKTKYRKPYIAMWDYMKDHCNGDVEIDLTKSVYVGDAAGRPEIHKKKKKDFSCSDRLFALNIGIKFSTTEEHFLGTPEENFNLPDFDPRQLDDSTPMFEPSDTKIPKYPVEVLILVGYPGSGKSFLSETLLAEHGYIRVNRDTLGTWQKCVSVMERALDEGKHVVVDNTNPDVESRKRYIDAASAKNVPVRCLVFNVTKNHARHNNKFRELIGEDHAKVNDMIFNSYKSKYREPSLKENLKEIIKVNFVLNLRNKENEKIYKMFLLDK